MDKKKDWETKVVASKTPEFVAEIKQHTVAVHKHVDAMKERARAASPVDRKLTNMLATASRIASSTLKEMEATLEEAGCVESNTGVTKAPFADPRLMKVGEDLKRCVEQVAEAESFADKQAVLEGKDFKRKLRKIVNRAGDCTMICPVLFLFLVYKKVQSLMMRQW